MTTTPATTVTTWAIDPAHSSAEFAVKHMMVSTVRGRFRSLAGAMRLDESDPANSSVEATIDVTTIDTSEAQRDAHLRSDDFFAADRFPVISFRSRRVEAADSARFRLVGDLTIRDVTKEVVLEAEREGQIVDPWGKTRAGFSAETAINRKEFGLNWNGVLEAGGVLVGDKVRIQLNIEAVQQD